MVKCKLDGKVWFIYENMNEFSASIHKDKLMYYREAQVGDYVLSDNGYYIPVIRRYEYVKTTRFKEKVPRCKLTFPFYTFNYSVDYLVDRKIIFTRALSASYSAYKLSGKELAILKLLKSGYSLVDCIKHVYPNRYFMRLIRVLSNPIFINKIEGMAMSLKSQIESQGINHEYIAKKMKDILEAPKPNATLVKYALETSIQLLEKVSPNVVSPTDTKSLVNEIRSELSSSMVN